MSVKYMIWKQEPRIIGEDYSVLFCGACDLIAKAEELKGSPVTDALEAHKFLRLHGLIAVPFVI